MRAWWRLKWHVPCWNLLSLGLRTIRRPRTPWSAMPAAVDYVTGKGQLLFPIPSVTTVRNPLVLNRLGASLLTIAVLQTLQTMEHREAELADLKKVLGTMLVSGL